MKALLPVSILSLSLLFFISCNPGHPHIKKYYSELDQQTVFVHTVETVRPSGCYEKGVPDGVESETCKLLLQNLPELSGRYVGTGTFIKYEKKIHVLTAEHVCNPDEFPATVERGNVVIGVSKTSKITINSRQFETNAKIIKLDPAHDLCLLELEQPPSKIKPAKIARKSPKRGHGVHYAGAPYGMISENFLLTFDGTYAGLLKPGMVFSLPCASGASGSSIRDKDNKIVSMVQRVHPNFNHICLGVSTKKLRGFLSLP